MTDDGIKLNLPTAEQVRAKVRPDFSSPEAKLDTAFRALQWDPMMQDYVRTARAIDAQLERERKQPNRKRRRQMAAMAKKKR